MRMAHAPHLATKKGKTKYFLGVRWGARRIKRKNSAAGGPDYAKKFRCWRGQKIQEKKRETSSQGGADIFSRQRFFTIMVNIYVKFSAESKSGLGFPKKCITSL